jgi:tRNA isopentenyl-2-thiomethyl-A-37 hydroxylase MiaE
MTETETLTVHADSVEGFLKTLPEAQEWVDRKIAAKEIVIVDEKKACEQNGNNNQNP